MNQDEFNSAETESKLRMELVYQEVQKRNKAMDKEYVRPWVGLTDAEIWETISRIGTSDSDVNPYAKLADARAIETKLKEKNT